MEYNDVLAVSKIYDGLRTLEYDVTLRNVEMNKRDRYIYEEGVFETLTIPLGHDKTLYNYLPRIVDIHTAQLMGRGFSLYSRFDKEDLSLYTPESDPQGTEKKAAEQRNKVKKMSADARKKAIEAIIRDNGGYAKFKDGARIGSAYGETVFKGFWNDDKKTYEICLLESPQNYRAFWSNSDFRERDADAYVYQISPASANKLYGSKLAPGEIFTYSTSGNPFDNTGSGDTSDPIDQARNTTYPKQTQIPMVTVIDYTGILPGYCGDNGKLKTCESGKETEVSVLVVGRHIVQVITKESDLPKYWNISNRRNPRRAWGASDISESAMQIMATIAEKMSDYVTLTNKSVFPLILAKGYEPGSIPKKKQREMQVVAADLQQSIETVNLPQNFGFEFEKLLVELKQSLVRETGVTRALFEDPTLDANSNQALLTMLKPILDIVEDKQGRWEPVLIDMFMEALRQSTAHNKQLADTLGPEEEWYLYVQWPSVFRKEDNAFQTMWINRLNGGTVSIDTFLEQMGTPDVSEEIDRIRDNLNDPVPAAILSKQLGAIAGRTIYASYGQPPPPDVKINLRGDLTPNQEANLANQRGLDDGPFPPSAGPQGRTGLAANDNLINEGFINGDAYSGGTANQMGAPQQDAQQPMQTPADNHPGAVQPMSQNGTGATPVSARGAQNQAHQQGR